MPVSLPCLFRHKSADAARRNRSGRTGGCEVLLRPAAGAENDDAHGGHDQQNPRGPLRGKGFAEDRDADDDGRQRLQGSENRSQRRADALNRLHQRHVGEGRGGKRETEDAEPRHAVGFDPDAARQQAAEDKIERPPAP